eukprot:CAMPEP_0172674296 /NCGR_PEP_ID=MMETSP1074-20121228/12657_1 /TAXON_ID=2916 /ORGANISM="Ceratium fusus, Strain PA161109" /LENGTH=1015 /DNA_ID=CAMNT_0013491695 /DNA_START=1 /DNA_END=3048 /DNA_ORIENTATION=+
METIVHEIPRPVVHEVIKEVPGKQVVQQHTVVEYKHEIQEVEKIVEVPSVAVSYREEPVVVRLINEKIKEVPQVMTHHVQVQEARLEYEERLKEVPVKVFQPREALIEVPHTVHKELLVEVPHVQIVDLVKQVPREQRQRKVVHVDKPIIQTQDKVVQVPTITYKEQIVEVPTEEVVEISRQVPGPNNLQQVEKHVDKVNFEFVEQVEEVPMVELQEQVIEVPQVEVREVVKQIPRVDVKYVDKQVPKVEVSYVEKIVEIPHIIYEERIVEVPEVEIREVVRKVPKPVVQYVDKPFPKKEMRYFEKVVEAPLMLEVEQPVEVPQVLVVETTTQTPKTQIQTVDKEVKKPIIQAQEVEQEVSFPVVQERIFEVDQIHAVDTVTQVSCPKVELRDKVVPRTETRVVEKVVPVPQVLTREVHNEVPQVQYVETIREEPDYKYKEMLHEIPKWSVNYTERVEEVRQECVQEGGSMGAHHQHSSVRSRELGHQAETSSVQTFGGTSVAAAGGYEVVQYNATSPASVIITPVTSVQVPVGAAYSPQNISPVVTMASQPTVSTTYPTVASQAQGRQGPLPEDRAVHVFTGGTQVQSGPYGFAVASGDVQNNSSGNRSSVISHLGCGDGSSVIVSEPLTSSGPLGAGFQVVTTNQGTIPAGCLAACGTTNIVTEPQSFACGDSRTIMANGTPGTMAGGYTVVAGQDGQAFMEPVATSVPVDAVSVQTGFTNVSGHPCQAVFGGPGPAHTATTIQIAGTQGTHAMQGTQVFTEPAVSGHPCQAVFGGPGPAQTATTIQIAGTQGTQVMQGTQVFTEPVVSGHPCPVQTVTHIPGNPGPQTVQGTQVLMEPVATSMPVDSSVMQGTPGCFASMAGQAGHTVQIPGVQMPPGQLVTAMPGGATSCPAGAIVPTASNVLMPGPPGRMVVSAAGGTRVVMGGNTSGAAAMGGNFSCGTMPAGAMAGGGMAGMAMYAAGGILKAGSITDDVFNMVDRNQDGVISRSEFRGALKGNIIAASQTTRSALGR